MFCFFAIFFSLSFSVIDYGVSKIDLNNGSNHLNIDFQNDSLFLFASENSKFLFEKNQKKYMTMGSIIDLGSSLHDIDVVDKNTTVFLWRMPKSLCSSSLFVSSDYLIDFSSKENEIIENNTCVFFQMDAIIYFYSGTFSTNSKTCKLEFFNSHSVSGKEKPKEIKESIKGSTPSPFFLRFVDCESQKFDLNFHLTVARSNLRSYDCNVRNIPTIDGKVKEKSSFKVDKCVTASHQFVVVLKFGIIMFSILILILYIIVHLPKKETVGHIAALEKK